MRSTWFKAIWGSVHELIRFAMLCLVLAMCWLWLAIIDRAATDRPPARTLDRIDIGSVVTGIYLGGVELGHNPGRAAADDPHLLITLWDNEWAIASVSQNRPLPLLYERETDRAVIANINASLAGQATVAGGAPSQKITCGGGQKADRIRTSASHHRIQSGDVVIFEDNEKYVEVLFDCEKSKPNALDFEVLMRKADGKTTTLSKGTIAQQVTTAELKMAGIDPACEMTNPWSTEVLAALRRYWRRDDEAATVAARFGGGEDCVVNGVARLRLDSEEPPRFRSSTFEVLYHPVLGWQVALRAGTLMRVRTPSGEKGSQDLRHPFRFKSGAGEHFRLSEFSAGRSRYTIEATPRVSARDHLTIRPKTGLHLLPAKASTDTPGRTGADEPTILNCADTVSSGWQPCYSQVKSPIEYWRNYPSHSSLRVFDISGFLSLAGSLKIGSKLAGVIVFCFTTLLAIFVINRWEHRRPYIGGRSDGRASRWSWLTAVAFGATTALWVFVWLAPGNALPSELPTLVDPKPAIWAWGFAAIAVFAARGGGKTQMAILILATFIIASGHITLSMMGFSSDLLANKRFADDTTIGIAFMATVVAAANVPSSGMLVVASNQFVEQWRPAWGGEIARKIARQFPPLGMLLAIIVAAFLLALWGLAGTETGVGSFQPSEAIKTLLVLVLAAFMSLHFDRDHDAYPGRDFAVTSSLLFVVLLILVAFLVPVVKSDHSPFLIISLTCVCSLVIVSIFNGFAALDRINGALATLPPPLTVSRLQGKINSQASLYIFWQFWDHFKRSGGTIIKKRWLEIFAFIVLISLILVGKFMHSFLNDPVSMRSYYVNLLGGPFTTPISRIISWIEVNAQPIATNDGVANAAPGAGIAVEFADVATQVLRSRAAIRSTECVRFLEGARWPSLGVDLGALAPAASAVERGLASLGLASSEICPAVQPSNPLPLLPPAPVEQYAVPEIQNDFISAWVFVALGRDGAYLVAVAQVLFVLCGLLAAYRVMRWRSGNRPNRRPAAFVAFACVGFVVMLSLQWMISWANAFGFLPVMGQPSTFFSHGRSHLWFFGTPILVFLLASRRIASALEVPPPPQFPTPPTPYRLIRASRVKAK